MPDHTTTNNERGIQESSIYSYHLTLFSDADEIYDLWLPKVPEGYFHFSSKPEHRFLSISAKDGQWIATCQKPAFFKEVPFVNSYEIPLSSGEILKIGIDERTYLVLIEKVIPQRNVFHNYSIQSEVEISIGSQPECDIYYRGPFVSRKHAVLSRSHGQWTVHCLDGLYGMFINNEKRTDSELKLGDVIYIMGLKIIIGQTFLSINSGLGEVVVSPRILQENHNLHNSYSHYSNEDAVNDTDKYFNRAPRKRRDTEPKVITVEGPPLSMNHKQLPLMLRLGGSMVMGGSAALAGNFMTLITSVMFPFLSSKYTENQRQEYEKLRVEKYTEYLQKKRLEIAEAIVQERNDLNAKHPIVSHLIENGKMMQHLWERRPMDSDFLQLRLGTGIRPLSTAIEHPPRNFELEPDDLEEKMFQLVEKDYTVDQSPIVLSLTDTYICGVEGHRRQVLDFIRSLTLQTVMFHSYDEVKMVFLMSKHDMEALDDIRYLPHVWDDQRSTRLIATNEAEAYAVGEYLSRQLGEMDQGTSDLQKILKNRPFYIVFALDKKVFDAHEVFKQLMQSDTNPGAAVISAHAELPKESQKIITLQTAEKNICTTMGVDGGEDETFSIDPISHQQAKLTMRELSNISLKKMDQAQAMPKMVTFLEMFKVGRIEQLNALKRWRENNPVKSLAAPVGVGEDGSTFMLDLHEKRQGPHGLVAGMTGSGKSEFIITYILSMAVNYHPDEVAFVLIDYKGGGLADAFENPRTGMKLPHLAGTITNLDGASIQRSLMSIESELVRRQKEFSKVSKLFNEGSMNIYTYQKLYRAGKVSEPMPHLFIISDEFAELKQQQPEFMDKLISAARIGRSLGVHLILATQKPSGVVNDQIRSNTKFRVCLRVQERSDSQDMLKRPEAAELTDTGRFYLQVGYNEFFALGQSAWCGADYEPQDTVPVQRDDAVEFLDVTGQVTAKAKPKVKKSSSGMKQIVAVVNYLSELAKNQNVSVRSLWNQPLTTQLDMSAIGNTAGFEEADKVSAVMGMIDDPERQRQFPFVLPLQSYQHLLLVGNSGSGKTTFLRTMLYSLTDRYRPDQVNYYILDFSGGTLGAFRSTPHCGAMMTENDEPAIERFMLMLRGMIKDRKALFNKVGVTSFEACKAVSDIPLVFVVIDNASGMSALKNGNTYFSTLHEYIKEASGLGIKFVISCSNLNEVSTRTRQEIANRVALQLKDKYAYADVLGGRSGNVPQAVNGRGMCIHEGKMMEFQVAVPFIQSGEVERMSLIAKDLEKIIQRDKHCKPAQKLPVIDPEESYEAFCRDIPEGRIPLGYDTKNIKKVSIPFAQLYTAAMYFGKENATAALLENLSYAAQKNGMSLIFVRSSDSVLDNKAQMIASHPDFRVFHNTKKSSLELCYLLMDEIKSRKVFRNEYCTDHGIPLEQAKNPDIVKKASSYIRSKTKPLMIIVEDMCEFSENLEDGTFSIYQDIFHNGKGYNFYFFSCFYPHNSEKAATDLLTKAFVEKALLLLYGGQHQKQMLAAVPAELKKGEMAYNQFLMRYNGGFYPMVMPCREPDADITDLDELPII